MRAGCAVLLGVALALGACGRAAPDALSPAPEPAAFQALVAAPPDPEGNSVTRRFDSASGLTRATLVPANAATTRFTPSGSISYLLPDGIRTEDLAAGSRRMEAGTRTLVMAAFTWSPDGALAYVAQAGARATGGKLVIQRPGRSPVTIALPPAAGGPAPVVRFSPDGRLLLLANAVAPAAGSPRTTLQVRGLDGRLVFGPATVPALPSDAAWAGGRLYFQDDRGVNAADLPAGTTRTVLPGLRWHQPDASPDGHMVVFELRDGRGEPSLRLLDTATDAVLPGFRRDGAGSPRFVSPTEIWFHESGGNSLVSLDPFRLTETPTGLRGVVTDVRQVRPSGPARPA